MRRVLKVALIAVLALPNYIATGVRADQSAAVPADNDEDALKVRIGERTSRFYAFRNEALERYAADKDPVEQGKIYSEITESEETLYRELIDMAFASPKSEAARDAS